MARRVCNLACYRTGREKRLEQRQITTLACAVGLLVLSTVGLLAVPPLSLALEKYGRPLPSMDQPNDAAAREAEETLFGGYFLSAVFLSNPTFAARPDNTGLVGLRHMLHMETDLYTLDSFSPLSRTLLRRAQASMETEWYNRAEAIQQRITQLRDSL